MVSVPWFSQVRVDFHVPTRVKFMGVNKIEAMFERPRVNVKLSGSQLLRLRVIFHTLPLVSCLYFIYACTDVKITSQCGNPPKERIQANARQQYQIGHEFKSCQRFNPICRVSRLYVSESWGTRLLRYQTFCPTVVVI